MLGKGHAMSGAAVWLTGWSWASLAGAAHPRPDVLVIGTLVCAGAALAPDADHPGSRIANCGGPATRAMAHCFAALGATVHAATKLKADRPDEDGHRTLLHTGVFAVAAGLFFSWLSGESAGLGRWMAASSGVPGAAPLGKLLTGLIVYFFVQIGFAAGRAALPGTQKRVRLRRGGRRWRKSTIVGALCAVITCALVPATVWWLGLAITVGCLAHLAGDMVTASGCPVLWPIPIPQRTTRYDRRLRERVPVRIWRTWYLVGTPKAIRFRVGSKTETWVTRGIVAATVVAIAGLVYAGGWGAGAGG